MKNKLKLLICTLSIFCTISIYSQSNDPLDFKVNIEKITNDSNSNYYYPKLEEKIKNNPSKISTDDCFYLYYGQIFQKKYAPLSFLGNPERGNFEKVAMNGVCKKILELGIPLLEQNPIDLTVLLSVCNCISNKGYTDTAYYFEQRYKKLLDAILSTGDGNSINTAIKIVNMEDDYILKGVLGFLGGEEQLDFANGHAYSIWVKKSKKLYFEDVMTAN
jgi:hypothetical protein